MGRDVVDPAPTAPAVASSPARHSKAIAPWPACGRSTDTGSRSTGAPSQPSRSSAAGRGDDRVDRAVHGPGQPRSPCCPAGRRTSGRAAGWPAGPGAGPSRSPRPRRPTGRPGGGRPARPAGPPASGTAASTSPSGVTGGRSLAECTATSARPSRTAAWISFTKMPWPADPVERDVGLPVPLGADDLDDDVDGRVGPARAGRRRARPGSGRAASRGWPVGAAGPPPARCARPAPRALEVEEEAERLDEPLAARRPGRLPQQHGRLVEQLGQHRPGDRVDLLPVRRRQVAELAAAAPELRGPGLLQPAPQRRRSPAPRREPGRPPGTAATSSATITRARSASPRRSSTAWATAELRSSMSTSVTPAAPATVGSTFLGTPRSTTSTGRARRSPVGASAVDRDDVAFGLDRAEDDVRRRRGPSPARPGRRCGRPGRRAATGPARRPAPRSG